MAGTLVDQPTAEVTESVTAEPTLAPSATPAQILGRFATDTTQIGYLRVVHAAPDTPAVDVYVDSSPLVSGLEFGLASGRTNVINGQYTVYIVERGSEPPAGGEAPANALVSAEIDLPVGASTLLVLLGTPDDLTLNSFEETNETLESDQSRISVINAIPSAPEISVRQVSDQVTEEVGDQTEEPAGMGEPLVSAVGFGQRSTSVDVPTVQTVLDFEIDGETVFSYPFNPLPRTDYILVFYGNLVTSAAEEAEAVPQYGVLAYDHLVPGRAQLRAINASTATTSLDVYLNGQLFSPNVGVNSAGERQSIPDGQYTIQVYPAGAEPNADNTPLVETQYTLLADTTQALILTGSDTSLQVQPFTEALSPLAPETARIAYINALESTPAAQVGNDSAVRADIGSVGFGQGSAYYPINIGVNNVFWSSDEGFLEEAELQIEAGYSYLYFLTGGETPFLLSEQVGIDEDLGSAVDDLADILFTPDPGMRIRVINMNSDSIAIDFSASGTPVAENLGFGESSDFQEVATAILPVSISQSGGGVLQDREVRLAENGSTTIIVFGEPDNLSIYTISEQGFNHNDTRTTLRFINASIDERVSMGLIVTEPSDAPTLEPPADGTPAAQSMVPIGSRFLIEDQSALTTSEQIPVPLTSTGFIIADNRTNLIGTRIPHATLQQGVDYDIVAIYMPETDTIRAVVVPYSGS